MKRSFITFIIAMVAGFSFAAEHQEKDREKENKKDSQDGEVVAMNKALFISEVFDFEKSPEWKYIGNKPAIIDLYADWCPPCRAIAPIMKSLAKEYAGKIVIYKVNVDKEKELASFFQATSIPLVVYIPIKGEPQFFRGATDKAKYKKAIDEFLLRTE
jgi:thioredoxin 1